MSDAIFYHGNPLYLDWVNPAPGVDLPAGTVLDNTNGYSGERPLVLHVDIEVGKKEAIAAEGGVYMMNIVSGLEDLDLLGAVAWWAPGSNDRFVRNTPVAGDMHFGYFASVEGGVGAGQRYPVIHRPNGTTQA